MGLLSAHYLHDIFVSYSHFAVAGEDVPMKQWSRSLKQDLEQELRQEPDFGGVSIFFDEDARPDRNLDPTLPLGAQLQKSIQGAGILVVLMTPHYLGSHWCEKERGWWQEKNGTCADGAGRVFVVRAFPTKDEDWPAFFKDAAGVTVLGFSFLPRSEGQGLIRPHGYRGLRRQEYDEQLMSLAGRLVLRLRDLQKAIGDRADAKAAAERLTQTEGQSLYLFGRESHAERYVATRDALLRRGYAVFGKPDPVGEDWTAEQARARERLRLLERCDAMLVVSGDDDESFDGDLAVVGGQCRRLEAGLRTGVKPCAVVDRVGPPVNNPARVASARNLGIDWIDARPASWTSSVAGWLGQAGRQAAGDG
jgi:hypothetical protein